MTQRTVTLDRAKHLTRWRQPVALLVLMAAAMPIALATWSALLNTLVIEVAGFTCVEIGWLNSVRELPGFLAVVVILLVIFCHEQTLLVVNLPLLGYLWVRSPGPVFGFAAAMAMASLGLALLIPRHPEKALRPCLPIAHRLWPSNMPSATGFTTM